MSYSNGYEFPQTISKEFNNRKEFDIALSIINDKELYGDNYWHNGITDIGHSDMTISFDTQHDLKTFIILFELELLK